MLLKHLATSVKVFLAVRHLIPQSLNQCSILLNLTFMSSLHLTIIQPYLMLPSVLSEAREPQVTRFPMSSTLMSGSRAAAHPNRGESLVVRVGVLLV
jgi:hypothetical protein